MADTGTKTYKAAKRYIYAWGGGIAEGNGGMKDLLGGKGAGLAEMTNAGLPTPPGFTITTEACNDYFNAGKALPAGLWDDVLAAVKVVEGQAAKGFGDPKNPLLVSVRSGAKFSMPGMMDTVLNLGLNEATLQGLIAITGNERFGWDAYRRFISMFGRIVLDVPSRVVKGKDGSEVAYNRFDEALDAAKEKHGKDAKDTDLDVDDLKKLVTTYKTIVKDTIGRDFPDDPNEQLDLAIKAVFGSWFGKRATDYRNSQKIAHDLGTAVNVVTMVFGNMGDDSGTGVAFTRDPNTGEKALYGEYLVNAQGEDVVAGIRTPSKIASLAQDMPKAYAEFKKIAEKLEKHYKDVQDLEFTIERGRLYMLQTRSAKRTAAAAVRIAIDMVKEKLITHEEALARIEPAQVDQLLRDQFDPVARAKAKRMAKGLNASPGAAVGKAVFHADTAVAWVEKGQKVVLVREETSPDDFHGMAVAQGILTAKGGATSHAAVVARQIGKPCVAGCAELEVNYATRSATANGVTIKEGDPISLDGSSGEVFVGALPTVHARYEDQKDLQTVLGWADKVRRLQIWTNADKPEEAAQARSYGAQGIGLCRTEHMFREGPRLEIVRAAILVANVATRAKGKTAAGQPLTSEEKTAVKQFDAAMAKLEALQQGDFEGILAAMSGLPVVIRLIDPPLHEFLPNLEDQLVKVTKAGDKATAKDKELLATIKSMHEQNPMLGLRGCRLGLMIPDFVKIQTRAILNAAVAVKKAKKDPRPEIMIPLVGHVNELKATQVLLEAEAASVVKAAGVKIDYKFGTMIEIPRACWVADEIAEYAQFFSFGTNDLTQMTFGYSRDDAEGGFLLKYVEDKILPYNPFQSLDSVIVKEMKLAVELGRKTRPDLKVGICGEHGGDPMSIGFCHQIGLNYVSCSPFRVPVARLAAAQAALSDAAERDR
ncbi:MAG: pyruvate, phosphate dikinase [Candidatus Limnocylindrales bacterium]|jgi:pyruvate,orthophosphate dikinase